MNMRFVNVLAATALFSFMAVPSWAKSNSNGSLKTTIDLESTTTVRDKTLPPGQYKVIADGNEASFELNGKIVAEVPCSLKTLSSKAPQTAFVLDSNRLTEIQVSGKTQAIEFASSQNAGD